MRAPPDGWRGVWLLLGGLCETDVANPDAAERETLHKAAVSCDADADAVHKRLKGG